MDIHLLSRRIDVNVLSEAGRGRGLSRLRDATMRRAEPRHAGRRLNAAVVTERNLSVAITGRVLIEDDYRFTDRSIDPLCDKRRSRSIKYANDTETAISLRYSEPVRYVSLMRFTVKSN